MSADAPKESDGTPVEDSRRKTMPHRIPIMFVPLEVLDDDERIEAICKALNEARRSLAAAMGLPEPGTGVIYMVTKCTTTPTTTKANPVRLEIKRRNRERDEQRRTA
jgi:hypothetical protein